MALFLYFSLCHCEKSGILKRHCSDEYSKGLFHEQLLLLSAQLCSDIYKYDHVPSKYQGVEIDAKFGGGGIPKFWVWKQSSDKERLFIIIRGSVNLEDWVDNLNLTEVYDPQFKAYFRASFLNHGRNNVWKLVKEIVQNFDGEIYFVGHSRGAALAQVAFVCAKNEFPQKVMCCYCFAAPQVMTNQGTVKNFSNLIYSIIHNKDPVPLLSINKFNKAFCQNNFDCSGFKQTYPFLRQMCQDPYFCEALDQTIDNTFSILEEIGEGKYTSKIDKTIGVVYHLKYTEQFNQPEKELLPNSFPRCYLPNPDSLTSINFLGIEDHKIDKYLHYLDIMPCYKSNNKRNEL